MGPGQARNAGMRVARGRYIAFCSVDTPPSPQWLSERYAKHLEGFPLVAGSVSNGTRRHPVGIAGYLLEYSALVPRMEVLQRQMIPHALSFERSVLAQHGPYPEDVLTGEDTIVNERCVTAGLPFAYAPLASIEHRNPTSIRTMLSHAYRHGRGLAQCMALYEHKSSLVEGAAQGRLWSEAYEFLVAYGCRGLIAKWRRLRGCRLLRAQLVVFSPLILLASVATGAGVVTERYRLRGARVVRAGVRDT